MSLTIPMDIPATIQLSEFYRTKILQTYPLAFDYSESELTDENIISNIKCLACDTIFDTSIFAHLNACECVGCGRSPDHFRRQNYLEFLGKSQAKFGNLLYDFSLSIYTSRDVPMVILCQHGHVNLVKPLGHIRKPNTPTPCRDCKAGWTTLDPTNIIPNVTVEARMIATLLTDPLFSEPADIDHPFDTPTTYYASMVSALDHPADYTSMVSSSDQPTNYTSMVSSSDQPADYTSMVSSSDQPANYISIISTLDQSTDTNHPDFLTVFG